MNNNQYLEAKKIEHNLARINDRIVFFKQFSPLTIMTVYFAGSKESSVTLNTSNHEVESDPGLVDVIKKAALAYLEAESNKLKSKFEQL